MHNFNTERWQADNNVTDKINITAPVIKLILHQHFMLLNKKPMNKKIFCETGCMYYVHNALILWSHSLPNNMQASNNRN